MMPMWMVAVLVAGTGTVAGASTGDTCAAPDKDFASFLERFREDRAFRESRLLLPLAFRSSEPGGWSSRATRRSLVGGAQAPMLWR